MLITCCEFGSPKLPPVVPPMAPPSADAAGRNVNAAMAGDRKRRGFGSTMLTGGLGVQSGSAAPKTLLGQ